MTKKLATIIDIVFYSVIIFFSYIIIKYLLVYILPFIASFLMVFLLQKPAIKISNRIKIPKNTISLILIIILVVISISIILLIFSKTFVYIINFLNDSDRINNLFSYIKNFITSFNIKLSSPKNTPNLIFDNFNNFGNEVVSWLTELFISTATKIIKVLPGFLISVIISVVCSCYLAFEYDNLIVFIKKQLSQNSIIRVQKLKKLINNCFVKIFLGYATIFIITFLELLFGFWILNLKNSLILALIIAVIDILPIFGTGIVLVPYGILNIISNNLILGIGLIVLYIIITILRYFLEPKIIGAKVGINPIISLILMFLGLKLFGVFGLILLPILASIISLLNKEGVITLYK